MKKAPSGKLGAFCSFEPGLVRSINRMLLLQDVLVNAWRCLMLEWVMALSELCNRAIAAGKTIAEFKDGLLRQREKELLISAHHDGLFHLTQSDMYGRFVMTNTKQFVGEDPAITAHYLDSFTRLCSRGLVIHQSDELFRLTGQGFDIARKLAKSGQ